MKSIKIETPYVTLHMDWSDPKYFSDNWMGLNILALETEKVFFPRHKIIRRLARQYLHRPVRNLTSSVTCLSFECFGQAKRLELVCFVAAVAANTARG